ncbi:protein FAM124A-like [Polyodon spathula]|uniref:protein FAM124A-like n=1 Tax=Polyodon spathula TaxID=7913 RepID=UPI001B7E18EB|nr:protein FAM124A-like [Polyodon spathula]
MEKNPAEDDSVDSGAEIAGVVTSQEFQRELSMADVQDPFLVSVHIITDPGNDRILQKAMNNVLAWIRPDLQLLCVSERGCWKKPERCRTGIVIQPSLATILFLQEEYGEEQFQQLHQSLRRLPWQYHHTERVNSRMLPYMPCNQDFFTLSGSTPLWAISQVSFASYCVIGSSTSTTSWMVQRSCSLCCLLTVRHSPSPAPSLLSSSFFDKTVAFCFNIDALEDAKETDVDTGLKLTSFDMSVVSAYTRLAANFQSSSAKD